jgi:UDP-N-acetylmuramate--alanine ligase
MVGVAGTGMSSLATLVSDMNIAVSGSDRADSPTLTWLADRGVQTFVGHSADNVAGADLVVVSAAIPADNPEVIEARALGIPVRTHAQVLGMLMDERFGIAVAGTHGKSTTTAMVAHILEVAGMDPTLVGGAVAIDFHAAAKLGRGPHLVAEADEYARRFHELRPRLAIITSVEPDHLDVFGSFDELVGAFARFIDGAPPGATFVTCADDAALDRLEIPRRRVRYGVSITADWRLESFDPTPAGAKVRARGPDGSICFSTQLFGAHNALNALGAIAAAREAGVAPSVAAAAIGTFSGTRRRLERRGEVHGAPIFDDYTVHPTAIAATIRALRAHLGTRVCAVFQPHTRHRTWSLLDGFATAFAEAAHVIVTPIYEPAGREHASMGITHHGLVAKLGHTSVEAVDSLDEGAAAVRRRVDERWCVVIMGAGDVTRVAEMLVPTGVAR